MKALRFCFIIYALHKKNKFCSSRLHDIRDIIVFLFILWSYGGVQVRSVTIQRSDWLDCFVFSRRRFQRIASEPCNWHGVFECAFVSTILYSCKLSFRLMNPWFFLIVWRVYRRTYFLLRARTSDWTTWAIYNEFNSFSHFFQKLAVSGMMSLSAQKSAGRVRNPVGRISGQSSVSILFSKVFFFPHARFFWVQSNLYNAIVQEKFVLFASRHLFWHLYMPVWFWLALI